MPCEAYRRPTTWSIPWRPAVISSLEDRKAATNFAAGCAFAAGVGRIVYLGGLGNGRPLSGHLESRREVGEILRNSGVPTIEFRASIIIGSGSLSFELIRALVEKLPVMLTPKWVHTQCQPIAIDDVLDYLVAALHISGTDFNRGQVFEIGGPDRASYRDLMAEYARQRGLKRMLISVPVLSPRLSSLWLGLFTPVYARIGRKLVESLRNETVVVDESALEAFAIRPGVWPMQYEGRWKTRIGSPYRHRNDLEEDAKRIGERVKGRNEAAVRSYGQGAIGHGQGFSVNIRTCSSRLSIRTSCSFRPSASEPSSGVLCR